MPDLLEKGGLGRRTKELAKSPYTWLAGISLLGVGTGVTWGAIKFFRYLHSHSKPDFNEFPGPLAGQIECVVELMTDEGMDPQTIGEAIAELPKITPEQIARQIFRGSDHKEEINIKSLYQQFLPYQNFSRRAWEVQTQLAADFPDFSEERQTLGPWLGRISVFADEVNDFLAAQYRGELFSKGYEVAFANRKKGDFQAISRILSDNWLLPSLRRIVFGPELNEEDLENWVVVRGRKGKEKEAVAAARIIPISARADNVMDLIPLTFQGIVKRRVSNPEGSVLIGLGLTKDKGASHDAIAAMIFGLIDYAAKVGAHAAAIPTLLSTNPNRNIGGGPYESGWFELDHQGIYLNTDQNLFSLVGDTGAVTEDFLDFNVPAHEVWTLLGRSRLALGQSTRELARIISKNKRIRVDDSPVDLITRDFRTYTATIPAAWTYLDPYPLLQAARRPVLFR